MRLLVSRCKVVFCEDLCTASETEQVGSNHLTNMVGRPTKLPCFTLLMQNFYARGKVKAFKVNKIYPRTNWNYNTQKSSLLSLSLWRWTKGRERIRKLKVEGSNIFTHSSPTHTHTIKHQIKWFFWNKIDQNSEANDEVFRWCRVGWINKTVSLNLVNQKNTITLWQYFDLSFDII